MIARHLLADPFFAVLPRGHALSRKRVIDLADLADEPWVYADCGAAGPCKDLVTNACAAAGLAPQVVVESDDYPTAQGFVAAGLGVAIIPRLGLRTRIPASSCARCAIRSRFGTSTSCIARRPRGIPR